MTQEKRSPTGMFYEIHIFAKFIDFGKKICIYINSDLPYIVVLQQNSDSSQRKNRLSKLQLELNFKATGRKRESHSCKAMLLSFESFIQF